MSKDEILEELARLVDESNARCPSDPHRLEELLEGGGSLDGAPWVPAFKEQYVLMEGAAAVAPKAEQDVVFELKGDFAIHGFQARRLHCLESEPGTFTIVSQTVGGRPQRVLTAEVPAILMVSKEHEIPFRLHFCKPGEQISIRVRNDGPTSGDIRMGIVGDMWRPREAKDDAKTQRNQRKRKGNLGADET